MKKIVYAPGSKIRLFQTEVNELILAIAVFMIEPGEDVADWANSVFVSDESRLGDFLYRAFDLGLLAEKLTLPPLQRRDLVADVAEILHQMKSPN